MICVPYIINDNYKIAQLEGGQSAVPYYIIETDSTDEIELFKFEKSFTAFEPNHGIEDDYVFGINKDKCKVSSDKTKQTATITIAIECKDKGEASSITHSDFSKSGLSVEEGHRVLFDLREIGHNNETVSTIIVNIIDTVDKLTYKFGVNVAPKENICDIVIDFGSEASQIWTHCRGSLNPWHEGNQMPLFDNIKKDSIPTISSADDKDIYQFDSSNRKLFRSLFFIKKVIANTVTCKDLTFINRLNDLASILSNNIALPNLKLMEYNDVPLPQLTVGAEVVNIFHLIKDIRPEILKFFFGKALENIKPLAGNKKMACKLIFLVPNTYTQEMLSGVYEKLVIDINTLIKDNANQFAHVKSGIEVATFSESDASFFGWYTPSFFLNNKHERILMIDTGKGTTDFSVLDVNNKNGNIEVERIARSGFVGAGNVMTFAILASVYCSLSEKTRGCSLAQIIDSVKAIAYHHDYAKKIKLYGYLEEIKRNKQLDGRQSLHEFIISYPGSFTTLGSINIDKLNDIIEGACTNHCYIEDNDSVVNKYAQILTEQLMDELKYVYDENIPLDRLVFSGRGSMSVSLRQKIEDTLREINSNIEVTDLDINDMKTGCLRGPLNDSLTMDHMNMAIVGWPQQMKPGKGQQTKKKEKKNSWIERGKKFFSNYFTEEQFQRAEEDEELSFFANRRVVSSDSATFSKYQGQVVNIDSTNNFFILGNRRCYVRLGSNNFGEKRIYFDGTNFVVRDNHRFYEFKYEQSPSDANFITETFFPMTEGNSKDIEMPVLEDILISACPGIVKETPNDEEQSSNMINDDEDFTA